MAYIVPVPLWIPVPGAVPGVVPGAASSRPSIHPSSTCAPAPMHGLVQEHPSTQTQRDQQAHHNPSILSPIAQVSSNLPPELAGARLTQPSAILNNSSNGPSISSESKISQKNQSSPQHQAIPSQQVKVPFTHNHQSQAPPQLPSQAPAHPPLPLAMSPPGYYHHAGHTSAQNYPHLYPTMVPGHSIHPHQGVAGGPAALSHPLPPTPPQYPQQVPQAHQIHHHPHHQTMPMHGGMIVPGPTPPQYHAWPPQGYMPHQLPSQGAPHGVEHMARGRVTPVMAPELDPSTSSPSSSASSSPQHSPEVQNPLPLQNNNMEMRTDGGYRQQQDRADVQLQSIFNYPNGRMSGSSGRVGKQPVRDPVKLKHRVWLQQNRVYQDKLHAAGFRVLEGTNGSKICSLCNKHFPKEMFVWRHALNHVDEKPFHCTVCDQKFTRSDTLQRHIRRAGHQCIAGNAN